MKFTKILFICGLYLFLFLFFVGCTNAESSRKISYEVNKNSFASISIYAYDGQNNNIFLAPNMGHSFISIKNLSEEYFKIGKYAIEPNEEVTLGTWGQTVHWGIWYNLESSYMMMNRYDGLVSITRALDEDDIDKLTEYILVSDYWKFTKNCTDFSLELWNLVATEDEIKISGIFSFPKTLKKKIEEFNDYMVNDFITTSKSPCYYEGDTQIICIPEETY